jgi:hypothetical protein
MVRLRERGEGLVARIDFGKLREFHLLRDWSDQSAVEEELAFENLVFVVRNYLRRGYAHVIVEDLKDFRVVQMAEVFAEVKPAIVTLVLRNEAELRRRVAERDLGWKDGDGAAAINAQIRERGEVRGERKIEVGGKTVEEVGEEAMGVMEVRE